MKTKNHMKDLDRCIVCKRYIGKGNDPAVCRRRQCNDAFELECEFNRFAADLEKDLPGWSDEQIERYKGLYKNTENWDDRIE